MRISRKYCVIAAVLLSLKSFCQEQLQQVDPNPFVEDSIMRQSFVTIRDVKISGNKKTKPFIVAREVLLKKGSSYTISDILSHIRTSRQNLMNTSLFVDATVNFTRWENDSLDIMVDVKERWYYFPVPFFKPVDRNWNVWINQNNVALDRVNYGIKFQGKNITGRNDKINLTLVNGYARQVSLSYYNPFFDKKLQQGFGFDLSYSQSREVNYSTRKNQQVFFKNESGFVRKQMYAGLSYSYRKGSIARHFLRLGLVYDNVADTVVKLNPKFFNTFSNKTFYPELSYRYQYLNVNYIPYPTRGHTLEFQFVKRGMGGSIDLWSFQGRASKYFTLPFKMYWSIQGEANLKLPFKQPFINQQMLGYGDSYLRGMEYYVVDGVAGGFLRNTLRKEMASFKVKTGIKSRTYGEIPFKIYMKAYGDLGYAYNPNNITGNILTNRFLYTGGFGVDVLTIYDIVIRLEYSFNQLNERAFFFHKNDF